MNNVLAVSRREFTENFYFFCKTEGLMLSEENDDEAFPFGAPWRWLSDVEYPSYFSEGDTAFCALLWLSQVWDAVVQYERPFRCLLGREFFLIRKGETKVYAKKAEDVIGELPEHYKKWILSAPSPERLEDRINNYFEHADEAYRYASFVDPGPERPLSLVG